MVKERYICIEPGYVSEFKTLKPEERFIGQQVLSTFQVIHRLPRQQYDQRKSKTQQSHARRSSHTADVSRLLCMHRPELTYIDCRTDGSQKVLAVYKWAPRRWLVSKSMTFHSLSLSFTSSVLYHNKSHTDNKHINNVIRSKTYSPRGHVRRAIIGV